MTTVITTNIVTDRDAYLPLAKAFAEDAAAHDKGCHGMKVLVNPEAQDEVTFVSHWYSHEDFLAHVQGDTFKKHIPGMGAYYVSGTDTFLEEA